LAGPEVAVDPRLAFTRAATFLDFSIGWKWGARVAAVFAAIGTLGLFVVLALFVDLLISRGRVPGFVELRPAARAEYDRQLAAMPSDKRLELLHSVSAPETATKDIDSEPVTMPVANRDWLWRGQVTELLRTRVNASAAETYRLAVVAADQPEPLPVGLLSHGLRQPGVVQNVSFWLASWNPWTWKASNSGRNIGYLFGLMVLAVLFAVFRAGMLNVMNYAAATATLDAATRLRRSVYQQSYRQSTLALRPESADETVDIFARNVEDVHDGLYAQLTSLFYLPFTLVILVLLALSLDVWLALASLMFGAVVILLGGYLAARFRDDARAAGRKAAGQLGQLRESLAAMRLVKSNLMELFNVTRVERQLSEYSSASFRKFRNESLFRPLLVFLATISAVLALFVAGYAALQGTVGPARLIVLAAVLAAIFPTVTVLLQDLRTLKKARTAAVPVFLFLDRPSDVGQVVGAEFLNGISRGIDFHSVCLREPGTGRLMLNDVEMKIKAGQRVAIVGQDDAEKHALVYMLLRFLDPTTGDVRIDDKSVRGLTLESLRSQIGAVMWDSLIFNDTVAHNIGCGEPSVSMPHVIECAKLAHVHQFVQKLPHGYETRIGEFGVKLGRSERFRIALARAILKDPSLYIIEEPAHPFDETNKAVIDDSLARVLPGKTVIFLAHRISTIRSCDLVYLIHKGQVEAAGEHRDLLARSELYKHLHYMEFNEFAKA
jgi:ATP-binding cassette, subfamily B, bacterial